MNETDYRDRVKQLIQLLDEANSKKYDWIKHIIVVASTLLSVLVALHTKKSTNFYERLSYVITVTGLALGILNGTIYLFSEIHLLHKIRDELSKKLNKLLAGQKVEPLTEVYSDNIYNFFFYMFLGSLLVSLLSLVLFAVITS